MTLDTGSVGPRTPHEALVNHSLEQEAVVQEVPMHRDGPSPLFCKILNGIFTVYLSTGDRGGLTVIGADNIPPEGPFILAPNHRSVFDHGALGKAMLDSTGRNINFMSKPQYWTDKPAWAKRLPDTLDGVCAKIQGRFIELGGGFAIIRGSPFHEQPAARDRIHKNITEGKILGIYAQGGRTEKMRLKGGLGTLAVKYGVPVIPVGLAGTKERDHMVVVFGEAMLAEHIDFDLGSFEDSKRASKATGEFRRELTVKMTELRDHAAAVRAFTYTY